MGDDRFRHLSLLLAGCGLILWVGFGCAVQQTPVHRPPQPDIVSPPQPPPQQPMPIPPQPKIPSPIQPDWSLKGSGAYTTSRGRVFYGVGAAEGISHRSLMRATADNRARDAIAGVLNDYMDALVQQAEPGGVDPETAQAVQSLTRDFLTKAVIRDHWTDAAQGKLFGLCSLDLATVKQILNTAPQLDEGMRAKLIEYADREHAALARSAP